VLAQTLNDLLSPDPCCTLNERLLAVTRLTATPLAMVIHPGVAAGSLSEYIALARARPDAVETFLGWARRSHLAAQELVTHAASFAWIAEHPPSTSPEAER